MITSLTNALVKKTVMLQTKEKFRRDTGLFVVEGVRMFSEIPTNRLDKTFVTEEFYAQASEKVRKRLTETGFETVSREVMSKMSDTATPQGVLCTVRCSEYETEQILGSGDLFVLLDGLQDPGNLGTIFRTSEAAGVAGIIMSRDCVSIYNPKSVRSTMGTLFRMPFTYTDDLTETMETMRRMGIESYAAHLKGTGFYDSFDYRKPTAFIIGNEGQGISDMVAAAADHYLKIPMEGKVESLNAAIAASVLLYEAHRQKRI